MGTSSREVNVAKNTPYVYDPNDTFLPFIRECCYLFRARDAVHHLFIDEGTAPPNRSAIWNAVAPNVFSCFAECLITEIYSIVGRLTDKDCTFNDPGLPNLTLRRAINDLGPTVGTPERDRLETLMTELNPIAEEMRTHRNKSLAHSDLQNLVDPSVAPLPRLTYELITKAVKCIEEIVNLVGDHHSPRHPTVYEGEYLKADAERLIETLKRGLSAAAAR